MKYSYSPQDGLITQPSSSPSPASPSPTSHNKPPPLPPRNLNNSHSQNMYNHNRPPHPHHAHSQSQSTSPSSPTSFYPAFVPTPPYSPYPNHPSHPTSQPHQQPQRPPHHASTYPPPHSQQPHAQSPPLPNRPPSHSHSYSQSHSQSYGGSGPAYPSPPPSAGPGPHQPPRPTHPQHSQSQTYSSSPYGGQQPQSPPGYGGGGGGYNVPPPPQAQYQSPPPQQQAQYGQQQQQHSPPPPQQTQQAQYHSPPPPPQQQPQSPPPQSSPTGGGAGGYQPVDFDGPAGVDVESFYGNLIDPLTTRPSPLFTRLSDALFFWLDSQCTVPGLRGTGVIEPEKYAWMSMRAGAGELEGRLLVEYIEGLYEAAGFPVQWRVRGDGKTIAVLDRRAFLHSQVFDARADPDETWKFWQKSLPLFHLTDPLTSQPFPTPLPRSAFPSTPAPSCLRIYKSWQEGIVVDVQRKEVERRGRESLEEMQRITGMMGAYQQQSQAQTQAILAAAGVGGGTGTYNYGGATTTTGGDSGDHATKMDAITSVASLLNTGLSIFGGGGLGGGLTGFGN